MFLFTCFRFRLIERYEWKLFVSYVELCAMPTPMAYDLRSANDQGTDPCRESPPPSSHDDMEDEEDLLLSVSGYRLLSDRLSRRALRPWSLLFSSWSPTLLPTTPQLNHTPRRKKNRPDREAVSPSSPSMSVESYVKLHDKLKRAPLRADQHKSLGETVFRELTAFIDANQHTLLLMCAVFALALFFNRLFLYWSVVVRQGNSAALNCCCCYSIYLFVFIYSVHTRIVHTLLLLNAVMMVRCNLQLLKSVLKKFHAFLFFSSVTIYNLNAGHCLFEYFRLHRYVTRYNAQKVHKNWCLWLSTKQCLIK